MNRNPVNATEIISGVFIGTIQNAQELEFYENYNIKSVVNCTNNLPFYKNDINQLRIAIDDESIQQDQLYNILSVATDFIHQCKPCLIHCEYGVSRSSSVYAAYLIKHHNHTPKSAIKELLRFRSYAFFGGERVVFADCLNKFYSECKHNSPTMLINEDVLPIC